MFDCRHVNQKTSRQSDVRSDARAFLGDWFLRDLNQNLLAFAQQIRDRRLLLPVPAPRASLAATIIAASAATAVARITTAARFAGSIALTPASWKPAGAGLRRSFGSFFYGCASSATTSASGSSPVLPFFVGWIGSRQLRVVGALAFAGRRRRRPPRRVANSARDLARPQLASASV